MSLKCQTCTSYSWTANLLSDRFEGKQSRKSVDLPLTCHPSASLPNFAFWSCEVGRLSFDLEPYGGTDPLGMSFISEEKC